MILVRYLNRCSWLFRRGDPIYWDVDLYSHHLSYAYFSICLKISHFFLIFLVSLQPHRPSSILCSLPSCSLFSLSSSITGSPVRVAVTILQCPRCVLKPLSNLCTTVNPVYFIVISVKCRGSRGLYYDFHLYFWVI